MTPLLTRTLLLLGFSMALLSCGGDDEPKPVSAPPTFLKVGTKYTLFYDDQFFNTDSVRIHVAEQLATDTFLIRNSSESISVVPTQYWVVKDNNLYISFRLRDPSTYQIECKFGKPKGTSWTVEKNGTTYTYSIMEVNTSITTGDGVVDDAIKIKIHAAGGQDYFQYISPTVGMLGNGSVNENVTAKLIHYTMGTTAPVTGNTPAISFGSLPFLAVGKYWNYTESDFSGNEIAVNLLIESKLTSANIYKVKTIYDSNISYAYWFEDNGMLMVYEEGETIRNSDPIYIIESNATLGSGWAGMARSGAMFIYTIESLDETMSTYFGDLSCMGISVSNGLFSSQTNYWNKNKGNVLVYGAFVSRDVTSSNARSREGNKPFIPLIGL